MFVGDRTTASTSLAGAAAVYSTMCQAPLSGRGWTTCTVPAVDSQWLLQPGLVAG